MKELFASYWPCLVTDAILEFLECTLLRKESRMEGLMKFICKKILEMGIIFRDESNDGN